MDRRATLWVNVVGAAEIGPWMSDGETSNVSEPHMQSIALTLTDPRTALLDCADGRLIGGDEVLGRPVTGVACGKDGGRFVHWIEDEIGVIIAGEGRDEDGASSWEFTELEFDPAFPPGIFDLTPDPQAIWFAVPRALSPARPTTSCSGRSRCSTAIRPCIARRPHRQRTGPHVRVLGPRAAGEDRRPDSRHVLPVDRPDQRRAS